MSVTDCYENSNKACSWSLNRGDIYEKLDGIRSAQSQLGGDISRMNTMLQEHMVNIRGLSMMKVRVGIMWGVMISAGALVLAAVLGAILSMIIKGG